MQRSFTDYHCHILPSLDDGASDVYESLAMAEILAEFGFSTVYCTPHRINRIFDNEPASVRQATSSLQRAIDEVGIALRLLPGTEHFLDDCLLDQVPDVVKAASSYLLLEAPFAPGCPALLSVVTGLLDNAITPLFAHPERCSVFDPARRTSGIFGTFSGLLGRQKTQEEALAFYLLGRGCRFQGNLGSFSGLYGPEVKERALFYLREGLYSCLGSDAHRAHDLAVMLSAGYHVIANEIGDDAAAALLSGSAL